MRCSRSPKKENTTPNKCCNSSKVLKVERTDQADKRNVEMRLQRLQGSDIDISGVEEHPTYLGSNGEASYNYCSRHIAWRRRSFCQRAWSDDIGSTSRSNIKFIYCIFVLWFFSFLLVRYLTYILNSLMPSWKTIFVQK